MSGPDRFDEKYTDYQLDRGRLRRFVRSAYLRRAASLVEGPTLDFGCGVGELLRLLPDGSRGLEYNVDSVEYCKSVGLPVDFYDGYRDQWQLSGLPGTFRSLVISHVLEHLESPLAILEKLIASATRLGVERVLVIVPGRAGYALDSTHRTFVDEDMLQDAALASNVGFDVAYKRYFPCNIRTLGRWAVHHELQVVYVKKDSRQ